MQLLRPFNGSSWPGLSGPPTISAVKQAAAAVPQTFLHHPVFMGRPDKPNDDDQGKLFAHQQLTLCPLMVSRPAISLTTTFIEGSRLQPHVVGCFLHKARWP